MIGYPVISSSTKLLRLWVLVSPPSTSSLLKGGKVARPSFEGDCALMGDPLYLTKAGYELGGRSVRELHNFSELSRKIKKFKHLKLK